jgi:hypothetical protein
MHLLEPSRPDLPHLLRALYGLLMLLPQGPAFQTLHDRCECPAWGVWNSCCTPLPGPALSVLARSHVVLPWHPLWRPRCLTRSLLPCRLASVTALHIALASHGGGRVAGLGALAGAPFAIAASGGAVGGGAVGGGAAGGGAAGAEVGASPPACLDQGALLRHFHLVQQRHLG